MSERSLTYSAGVTPRAPRMEPDDRRAALIAVTLLASHTPASLPRRPKLTVLGT